jgi:hypothetical protein
VPVDSSGAGVPTNLQSLEVALQKLSHDGEALKIIKAYANSLGKTARRQDAFNALGALVREPILYQDVLERSLIPQEEDAFTFLQGDIARTDAAYFLGERVTGTDFVVASSTCDLVPERRQYASLLRVQPITERTPKAKEKISQLLKFNSTKEMYLPPLPNDPSEVICNAVLFDGVVQVRLADLLTATRKASLSLVGWRIFGSLVRTIMVRAGESEIKMRSSV